jgi:hypothetical protein
MELDLPSDESEMDSEEVEFDGALRTNAAERYHFGDPGADPYDYTIPATTTSLAAPATAPGKDTGKDVLDMDKSEVEAEVDRQLDMLSSSDRSGTDDDSEGYETPSLTTALTGDDASTPAPPPSSGPLSPRGGFFSESLQTQVATLLLQINSSARAGLISEVTKARLKQSLIDRDVASCRHALQELLRPARLEKGPSNM